MDRDKTVEDEPRGRWERYKRWRRTPWFEKSRRARTWLIVVVLIWSVVVSIVWQFVKDDLGWLTAFPNSRK